MNTRAGLRLLPLTVGRHVDGSSHGDGRSSLRDAQHLHGLPLWSALTVTAQHGWIHTLPGRVCWARPGVKRQRRENTRTELVRKPDRRKSTKSALPLACNVISDGTELQSTHYTLLASSSTLVLQCTCLIFSICTYSVFGLLEHPKFPSEDQSGIIWSYLVFTKEKLPCFFCPDIHPTHFFLSELFSKTVM